MRSVLLGEILVSPGACDLDGCGCGVSFAFLSFCAMCSAATFFWPPCLAFAAATSALGAVFLIFRYRPLAVTDTYLTFFKRLAATSCTREPFMVLASAAVAPFFGLLGVGLFRLDSVPNALVALRAHEQDVRIMDRKFLLTIPPEEPSGSASYAASPDSPSRRDAEILFRSLENLTGLALVTTRNHLDHVVLRRESLLFRCF